MDTGCLAEAADLIGELRCHAMLQLGRVDADQGLLPHHSRRSSLYLRLLTAICHHLALKVAARVLQPKASWAERQSRGCRTAKEPDTAVLDAAPALYWPG